MDILDEALDVFGVGAEVVFADLALFVDECEAGAVVDGFVAVADVHAFAGERVHVFDIAAQEVPLFGVGVEALAVFVEDFGGVCFGIYGE